MTTSMAFVGSENPILLPAETRKQYLVPGFKPVTLKPRLADAFLLNAPVNEVQQHIFHLQISWQLLLFALGGTHPTTC